MAAFAKCCLVLLMVHDRPFAAGGITLQPRPLRDVGLGITLQPHALRDVGLD
jgi:hypothetical protein